MKLLALFIHSSSPLLLALSLSLSLRYAGCVAGIIGLTSLNGFALYVATHLIVSLVLVLKVQPRCNPLSHTAVWCNLYLTPPCLFLVDLLPQATPVGGIASVFPKSLVSFVLGGLMSNIVTFVLFWTLMYALVHLY